MFTAPSVLIPMDAGATCAQKCFSAPCETRAELSGLSLDTVLISAKLTAVKRVRSRLVGASDAVSR